MNYSKSINEFSSAKELIPGGVNSPVRAFKSVNCSAVFIASAKGSQIIDIDGNKYVDFVSSWGPMILGHANEAVLNAISTSAKNGTSYGAPTQVESLMAKKLISPGVLTNEIDASFLPAALGQIGAAIVGPASKGPVLVPTVIQDANELQSMFGGVFTVL